MSKYAIIFSTQVVPDFVAEQLMFVEEGYNYIEGEPCLRIDLPELEIYGQLAKVKFNGQLLTDFPSKYLRSEACFIVPQKFLLQEALHTSTANYILLDIPYDNLIKTDVTKSESGFICFGDLEVSN